MSSFLVNRIIHLTSLLLAAPVSRTESACALTDAIYAETLQHGERDVIYALIGLNLSPGAVAVSWGISSQEWTPAFPRKDRIPRGPHEVAFIFLYF